MPCVNWSETVDKGVGEVDINVIKQKKMYKSKFEIILKYVKVVNIEYKVLV